jgi:hypothetical protein
MLSRSVYDRNKLLKQGRFNDMGGEIYGTEDINASAWRRGRKIKNAHE